MKIPDSFVPTDALLSRTAAVRVLWAAVCLFLIAGEGAALAADKKAAAQEDPVKWQDGPGLAKLKSTAEVKLPEGFRFANATDTQLLLKAGGNPISGQELGLITAPEAAGGWWVVFEFADTGHIKDDEKDSLDADAMLKSIIKGNEYGNEERKRTGHAPLNIVGWEQKPMYNAETHNLEWAIRAESQGRPIINHNTRLLGRRGVMEVTLIVGPDELAASLPRFRSLLGGYTFSSGEGYAEYRQGDKLAQYGLAALVTGGAAVVAVKTGLLTAIVLFFKKAWKLVVIGVVAVAAFVRKLILGKPRQES